jgi:hypothetical protein
MKNLILITAYLYSLGVAAQDVTWTTPVSIGSNAFGNLHPRIVLDRSGDPMVLWGSAAGNAMFSRWSGSSFTNPVALNSSSGLVFTAHWAGPDIGNHGDTVYVIYKQAPETDSSKRIFLVRSFDGGQNFSAPVRVDFIGDSLSRFGTVTTDASGNPIVAYMKFNASFGDPRYVVTRSHDYGLSFMPDTKASGFTGGETCDCCPGELINAGSRTIMLYRNNLNNIRTIWAGISNNNGSSFTSGVEVDNTSWMSMTCPSSGPDGVVIGDTLYSVFRSSASGVRVYFSKTDITTGQLISSGLFIPNFTGLTSQDYPRITNNGNAAAVAWKQVSAGSARGVVSFTGNIQAGFNSGFDTVATGSVTNIDLAMKDGEIHVVWQNDANGTVMYSKGTYGPASVREVSNASHVDVYPNPASDYFTASLKDVVSCTLADVSGKLIVLSPSYNNGQLHVSVNHLPAGIYTVKLTDKKGQQYYSKLTVK